VPIGDDCVHRDESFLFKPNSDAVSAPSQASEKNQAMGRKLSRLSGIGEIRRTLEKF
jgi:hypothetical protein